MNLKQCSGIKTRPLPASPNQAFRLRRNHNPHPSRPIPTPRTPFFPVLLPPSALPTLGSHKVTNHPRSLQESHHPLKDSSHQWIPTQNRSTFLPLSPPIQESQPILRFFPMILVTMFFGLVGQGTSLRRASSATCKPHP